MTAAAAETFDVVILGGGTAGCVLAGRLSEGEGRSVCLIEAGPDYGPFQGRGWPPEMIDPRTPSDTHDWEPEGELSLARARVIGGCSSHNACFISRGHPDDYDEWAGSGCGSSALASYLDQAERVLGARRLEPDEVGAWARTVVEGAAAAGLPVLDDFNEPRFGAGLLPVNVRDGARWNTAFAYLDPARDRPNLTVLERTLVDRVAFEKGRAVGAVALRDGSPIELPAHRVIISAGAYGSPPILLRSGVGPPAALAAHDIEPVAAIAGVGENLQDHFGLTVVFAPTAGLERELAEQHAGGRMMGSGSIVKARSSRSPPGTWDLHLVTWSAPDTAGVTGKGWRVQLTPYVMKPRSRGRVRLRDTGPASQPEVELGYLADPDGVDLAVLSDGIAEARRIAATAPVARLLEGEVVPGPGVADADAFTRENVRGYFHPVGTCAMDSVVDGEGRVSGFDNLYVCDASIMPTIPRANTNLTTIAIAERVAKMIDRRGGNG